MYAMYNLIMIKLKWKFTKNILKNSKSSIIFVQKNDKNITEKKWG